MKDMIGTLVDELTIEEAAGFCRVEVEWLACRIGEGYFPGVSERRFPAKSLLRARRMVEIERNFEASPELAALVADLLEEIDRLKGK